MSLNPFKTTREYENAHIVLWIVKDSSWCHGWHYMGMIMILPTLLMAIDIARRSWRDTMEFTHNLAVCFWICANAVWMTGEFFFNDGWRPGAQMFFNLGVLALAAHYLPMLWRLGRSLGELSWLRHNSGAAVDDL